LITERLDKKKLVENPPNFVENKNKFNELKKFKELREVKKGENYKTKHIELPEITDSDDEDKTNFPRRNSFNFG
jgi:hypothetical protein